jgi:hypothetical protein
MDVFRTRGLVAPGAQRAPNTPEPVWRSTRKPAGASRLLQAADALK